MRPDLCWQEKNTPRARVPDMQKKRPHETNTAKARFFLQAAGPDVLDKRFFGSQ